MNYTILFILGALKVLSLTFPTLALLTLVCAAITKITRDKSWINKSIHKMIG